MKTTKENRMNLDSLTLGDIKQLKCLLGGAQSQPAVEVFKGKKIIIQQRGWVFVGDLYQNGDDCTLKNASNIRVWGTTKGLGEIATGGPTKDTKLDPLPDVHFHYLTMIAAIDVMDEKWKK